MRRRADRARVVEVVEELERMEALKLRLLTALGSALIATAGPAAAADLPPAGTDRSGALAPQPALPSIPTAAVTEVMAARQGTPIWYRAGGGAEAAATLSTILRHAALDGFPAGPDLALAIDAAASEAATGTHAATDRADRLMSAAWLAYVTALRAPASGLVYSDPMLAPRPINAAVVLAQAAAAPSPAQHLARVAFVNPIYAALRDAAWATLQQSGNARIDPRLAASLARARALPATGRFIVVDAATQRLTMVEDGRIADSMKVIVGRPDAQTPMLASTIWYATLNPYWYVPLDLTRKIVAVRMLANPGYLKFKHYEVISDFGENPEMLSPAGIDWKAVGAGTKTVYLRQLPGPENSMGKIKFPFPNDIGVYLHDTDLPQLFAKDPRTLSNGCIRLQDAQRLAKWMFGRDMTTASSVPEQHVRLDRGIPVFLTYLTAQPRGGQIAYVADVYGRDGVTPARVASR